MTISAILGSLDAEHSIVQDQVKAFLRGVQQDTAAIHLSLKAMLGHIENLLDQVPSSDGKSQEPIESEDDEGEYEEADDDEFLVMQLPAQPSPSQPPPAKPVPPTGTPPVGMTNPAKPVPPVPPAKPTSK